MRSEGIKMPKERKAGKSRSRGRRGFDNTVGQQSHTRILPVAKSNNLRLLFPEPGTNSSSGYETITSIKLDLSLQE